MHGKKRITWFGSFIAAPLIAGIVSVTALATPVYGQAALQKYLDFKSRQEWGKALDVMRAEVAKPFFEDEGYFADIRTLTIGALGDVVELHGPSSALDQEALGYYDKGLEYALTDPLRRAQLTQMIGLYYSKSGRNGFAAPYFEQNAEFWIKRGEPMMTMTALNALASVEGDRGSLEARDFYRVKALELAKDYFVIGKRPENKNEWLQYAKILKLRMDNIVAPENLEEVRRLLAQHEKITKRYLANEWMTYNSAAKMLALCGDGPGALAMLDKARVLAKKEQPVMSLIDLLASAAQVHFLTGDYETALEEHESWLLLTKSLSKLPVAHSLHGQILEKLGDIEGAIDAYKRSIELAEGLRSSYTVAERAQFFRSSVRKAYWGLIRCRARKGVESGSAEDFLTALGTTEILRARQFGELLAESTPIVAPNLASLRAGLGPNRAILDYIVTDEETLVFVMTEGEHAIHVLPISGTTMRASIEGVRERIAESPITRFKVAHPECVNKHGILFGEGAIDKDESKLDNFFYDDLRRIKADLQALSGVVLGPVAPILGKVDEVIVLSDGMLSGVPFGLLSLSLSKYEPLVRTHVVRRSPSLAYLASAERSPVEGRGFFGLGDPTYAPPSKQSKEHDADAGSIKGAVRASEYLADVSPLPNTRREVDSIAALFGGTPVKTLFGYDASESNVKSLPLREYGYLHFSTHASLGGDIPGIGESSLIFAHEPDENGFFTAGEVQALDLNAHVTVLSACSTGNGRYFTGEGVMGLGRAFLLAGSRSVVVSLWPVDTLATEDLVVRFYRYLLEEGDSGKAMRRTHLDMLDGQTEPHHIHPFYWAPFIVVGE